MRLMSVCLIAGLCVFVVGCEQEPELPPIPVATPTEPEPAVPTTQEIIGSPREPIQLATLPLTLDVPKTWKIEEGASVTFLQGQAIDAIVQIQLSRRSAVSPDELEAIEKGARDEQKADPRKYRVVESKDLGSLHVLERQSTFGPTTIPADDGRLITAEPLRWTISVYAPAGDNFEAYELIFIGMTEATYQKNREFLQSILATLKYRTPEVRPAAGS